ncbi:adenosylcobinamide-GDP ribazoletransferase [Nocardioides sp. TRM66260-LWL]|uniref:adenosylcobinamide-GDP ribazoletransferase n=1 Tax=Nocardioides sp. TRM66260-LWL TaxID=2874478 RepID=UPI001CC6D457|nr:adenosylcobinamide-GDP ribazoletransferase [Nocardioides sp. TRM66260-LWL]MBZ5736427.1 adenosylcobinamide-GDP ribazoletransferase [Nocardioides sp. TRM66260-LWL]
MLLDAWRLALGTLTAIPVAPPALVDRRRAGMAMVLAPLAVLPLAVAVTLVALAGHGLDLPIPVAALLALGATILGNRAFHLDGLSDTVDGMAASYDRERSLAVMKSGTSGPAGVVAVVLVLGLQATGLVAVLASPHPVRAAVLAGCALCVSRAALATCCARDVPSARPGGLGDTYTGTVARPVVVLMWLTCAAVLSLAGAWSGLAWWRGALASAMALAVVAVVVARAVRRLGGVTGDVFGAAIELALAALLVALS